MSTKKVLSLKNSGAQRETSLALQTILTKKNCGAFLLRGNRQIILEEIIATHNYQEVISSDLSTLGIDDVKKQIAQTDFSTETSRLVVFSFYHITLEAQNALLKFLEEPPKNTTIFLLTGDSTVLLPTVLSRVSECALETSEKSLESARLFLETEPVHRMNLPFIKKILATKVENSESIDKELIHDLIEGAIKLSGEADLSKLTPMQRQGISNCVSLLARLKQNGASGKQILEYVSLALPKR